MGDWRKIILNQCDTMKNAIDVLNNEALRIVLVVDQERNLVGTVTDGDIRRSLLKRRTMETELAEVMNSDPTIANENESRDEILQKMRSLDLLHIPITNCDGVIVGLETLQHLIEKKRYDNPVFLMAGGFGTRLRPLTEHIPKPMLNVGSKPILQTILEQFIDAGFHNFYISTHFKAEVIHTYFGNGEDWSVNIHYVHEEEPLGTAGALGLLPDDLPDLPIIMMNGDLLTEVDFVELLSFHKAHESLATMCVREYDFQVPFGVISTEEHKITNIVEKPVHKFFVNAGIYAIEQELIHEIDGLNYLDMPNFLEQQIEAGKAITSFPVHEYWLDIGRMEEYERANSEIVEIVN